MTKRQFSDGVNHLRLAFNLGEVRPEVLAIWYAHLSAIEQHEWQSIQRRIVVSEEQFPRNLIRCVEQYRERKPTAPVVAAPTPESEDERRANLAALNAIMSSIGRAMPSAEEVPF